MEWPLIAEMQQRLQADGVRRYADFLSTFVRAGALTRPFAVLPFCFLFLVCTSVMVLVQ
jgi:hypothetical protein